jgi:hypothetical protein
VRVLIDDEGYRPCRPGEGSKHLATYPWALALNAIEQLLAARTR